MTSWEMSGVACGITRVSAGDAAGSASDYGLATGGTAWDVLERYEGLAARLKLESVAVARQVHGSRVVSIPSSQAPRRGVHVLGEADGIVTDASGLLLLVTVADCVPVFMADASGRTLALLHAGWRGVVAGILEAGVARMTGPYRVPVADLQVHLGPAVCGACYEVGPEVLAALGLPTRRVRTVDLRALLTDRAAAAGIRPAALSCSTECTVCGPGKAHSYRRSGSSAGRMAAFLGRVARP